MERLRQYQPWCEQPDLPDGLDVLLLIDGHAVGSRRNAMLHCAPAVARKYSKYRETLFRFIHINLIHHQDVTTRILASQSLSEMVTQDLDNSRKLMHEHIEGMASAGQVKDIHGTLLLLQEVLKKDTQPDDRYRVSHTHLFALPSHQNFDMSVNVYRLFKA